MQQHILNLLTCGCRYCWRWSARLGRCALTLSDRPLPQPLSHLWERGVMKRKERTHCSPRPFTGEGLGERANRRISRRPIPLDRLELFTLLALMLLVVLLLTGCSPILSPRLNKPPQNLPALLQTCGPRIAFNPPTTLRPITLGAMTATVESVGVTCEWEF